MNILIPRNINPSNADFSDEIVSSTIRESSIDYLTVLVSLGQDSENRSIVVVMVLVFHGMKSSGPYESTKPKFVLNKEAKNVAVLFSLITALGN